MTTTVVLAGETAHAAGETVGRLLTVVLVVALLLGLALLARVAVRRIRSRGGDDDRGL